MKTNGNVNNIIFVTVALARYNKPYWLLNLSLESMVNYNFLLKGRSKCTF